MNALEGCFSSKGIAERNRERDHVRKCQQRNLILVIIVILTAITAFARETGGGVVMANNQFGLELYRQLKSDGKNIIISPFSIVNAFGMVYAGSSGQTKQEIAQTMHFAEDTQQFLEQMAQLQLSFVPYEDNESGPLNIANALWVQENYPVLESYLTLLQTYFQSEIRSVDFCNEVQTTDEINQWVSEKTNGKITQIITPDVINQMTTLILSNAIYFKGAWMNPFLDKNTKPEPFSLNSSKEISVEMMNNTKSYRYLECEEFKILEMPYRKEYNERGEPISIADYSMIVFLPDRESSLEQLENQLTNVMLESKIDELMHTPAVTVEVKIPKFRIENTYNLNEILIAMGMKMPFFSNADFSKITGKKDLFISDVLHKTYIDLDEKGTEAAAVTAVIMARGAFELPSEQVKTFHADRPFMYMIRENTTGSMIFVGKLTQP